ncbi:MAG TPA: hypothetical protein VH374_26130 [Polyangia bacterium]|nr:hypothetical protein [Polyangia bacterium]
MVDRPTWPPASAQRFAVTIASEPGYAHGEAFRETAESVHHALLALGHDSILSDRTDHPDRRLILFGANLITHLNLPHRLAPDSILYNLEQIYDDSPWLTPELLALYRRHVVWDYSVANIAALARHGVTARHVPIGYVPELTRIAPAAARDIDVLFAGSLVERRVAVLQAIHEAGANVVPVFGVYGPARDALIARAKIVLNLHLYDAKVFEIVRVSYLLANTCFVVSERGSDPAGEAPFADGLAFADYPRLGETCLKFLADPIARDAIARRGFSIISQRRTVDFLRAVL